MSRKLFSLIACLVLFLNFGVVPGSAQAEVNSVPYTWQQINTDGFGDPNNASAIPIVFNGKLYATTGNNASGAHIWEYQDGNSWNNVINDGFGNTQNYWISSGIVFNQELYLSTSNNTGAEIWRSSDGNTWTQVVINGFGDPSNYSIYAFEIFDDILYAGTVNNTKGGQLWYSADGNNWFNANPDGFGEGNWGIWGLASFHDDLYAGFGGNASIWKSPDGTTWTPVVSGGFGDPGNIVIGYTMKVFNNALYATTYNSATGVEIWRTLDGIIWDQVNDDGFGNAQQNEGARTLFVFKGELYAGIRNNAVTTSLWKTKDGTSWEEVNGDGFGDLDNFAIWGMAQYRSSLIVGTQNNSGGEVWKLFSKSNNEKLGSISGTVTDDGTGEPIEGIFVFACEVDVYCDSTLTDSKGFYKISLPPGTYRVGTYSETDYVREFYDDKLYWDEADDVLVTANKETRNINFALLPAGSISGTVTEEGTGVPIEGAGVEACDYESGWPSCFYGETDLDGNYFIPSVPAGSYRVAAYLDWNWAEELYSEQAYRDFADPVVVEADTETSGINFTLEKGGAISGTVTDQETGAPLAGAWVEACDYESGWPFCFYAETEADGSYFFPNFPVGSYRVAAYLEGNWVEELYSEQINWDLADAVNVVADVITQNIDFTLEKGGSISGTVTEQGTGAPIEGLEVTVCDYDAEWDGPCFHGWSESNGSYFIPGIPAGTYRVFSGWDDTNWIVEYYSEQAVWELAEPVEVEASVDLYEIDFTLEMGGSISGTVTAQATGEPIEDMMVEACDYGGGWDGPCFRDWTKADGSYFIPGVPEGMYRISSGWEGNWVVEYYNEQSNWDFAERVEVYSDANTSDINFTLEMGGSISGTITDQGEPVEGIGVQACFFNDDNYPCWWGDTDGEGIYIIPGVPFGTYRVMVYAQQGYLEKFYDNTLMWDEASPVDVTETQNAYYIDFTLEMGGSISGTVFEADGTTPIPSVHVDACSTDDTFCNGTETNEFGEYTITGLLPVKEYRVFIWGQPGWASEIFQETIWWEEATIVSPDATGIDFTLDPGGSISGLVTDGDGNPLAFIGVDIMDGGYGTCTDENGYYSIMGLPFGTYRVVAGRDFCEPHPYAEQVMPGITIDADNPNVSGYDFALSLGGSISGTVYEENSGDPPATIAGIQVDACSPDDTFCKGIETNELGEYTITGLPAGDYRVHAYQWPEGNWIDEVYEETRDWNAYTPVSVAAGLDTPNIDFTLDPAGSISGVVTDSSGNPLANMGVDVMDGGYGTCTDENGNYNIAGLPFGTYHIVAGRDFCGSHPYVEAVIFWVETNETTPDVSGIDFTLELGGSISGTVYEENSGDPPATIAGIQVDACSPDDTFCKGIETNELGEYTITGLPAGDYRVNAYQYPDGYWIYEVYEETRDWNAYTPVIVTAGANTSDINFTLELGGAITGVVTDGDGIPLEGLWVSAGKSDFLNWAMTDANGEYWILALPPGDYDVFVSQQDDWVEQHYITPVSVIAGQDTYDINFSLELGGSISGTVTDESGNHIAERIDVAACWVTAPDVCFWTTVQENNAYTIIGLPTGEFYVNVYEVPEEGVPGGNWIGETYPTTIALGVDEDVVNVDFMLTQQE